MTIDLKSCDQVEILTLQDNYIDLVSRDDTDMIKRARIRPRKGSSSSLLAEHGFSALVTITTYEDTYHNHHVRKLSNTGRLESPSWGCAPG